MSEWRLIVALILPWWAGAALMRILRPQADRAERLAAGWLLGQAIAITVLFVMLRAGATVSFWMASLPVAAIALAATWPPRSREHPMKAAETVGEPNGPQSALQSEPSSLWTAFTESGALARGLVVLAVALLVAKGLLVSASQFAPLRHDDAVAIWLLRAKVIAGLAHLPLDPADAYYLGGSHADYPLFASLVPAWIAIVCGEWRETWVTLPWIGFWIAPAVLIGAAGGRHDRAVAWAGAIAIASLPLGLLHTMRPGYADPLVGACLAAAVVYAMELVRRPDLRTLLITAAFAVATAWMKREGGLWVVLVAATLWLTDPRRLNLLRWRAGLAVGAAAVLAVVLGVPSRFVAETARGLSIDTAAPAALARHLFSWSSFGILWAVLLPGLVWSLVAGRGDRRRAALLAWVLVVAGGAIFVFTDNARFAHNDQTPSRVFLQLAPAVVFLAARGIGTGGAGEGLHDHDGSLRANNRG